MNSSPSNDPLVSLWQTAAKPDTQHLLQDLQRLRQSRGLLRRSVLAILAGVSVLLIVAEATGHIGTHGILSAIWIPGLAVCLAWQRRARCNHIDSLAFDTVHLLKHMLARAKNDLSVARYLYAGVPCGALAGLLAVKLTGIGASPTAVTVHPQFHLILTGVGEALLIVMVLTGFVMARSRRLQVKALSEKLRSLESEL